MHIVKQIIKQNAKARQFRFLISLLIALLFVTSLAFDILTAMKPYNIGARDFTQDYLNALAYLRGEPIYQPISDMAKKYFGSSRSIFDYNHHPTPHTPFTEILTMPMGFLSAKAANGLWVLISYTCLLSAITILIFNLKIDKQLRSFIILLCVGLCISTSVFIFDIFMGQFNCLLLLLVTAAYVSYKNNRSLLCGALLGITFGLRFWGIPFLIYFLIRRNWRLITGFCLALIFVSATVLLFFSMEDLRHYALNAVSQSSFCWKDYHGNLSLYHSIVRFFSPVYLLIEGGRRIHACKYQIPFQPMHLIIAGAVLLYSCIAMIKALKDKNPFLSFQRLIYLTLLTTPIVWDHYFVIIFLPLICLAHKITTAPDIASRTDWLCLIALLAAVFIDFQNISAFQESILGAAHWTEVSLMSKICTFMPVVLTLLVSLAPSSPSSNG